MYICVCVCVCVCVYIYIYIYVCVQVASYTKIALYLKAEKSTLLTLIKCTAMLGNHSLTPILRSFNLLNLVSIWVLLEHDMKCISKSI